MTPTIKQLITRLRLKTTTSVLNAPTALREDIRTNTASPRLILDIKTDSDSVVLFAYEQETLSDLINEVTTRSIDNVYFWVVIPRFNGLIERLFVKEAGAKNLLFIVTEVKVHPKWMAYRLRFKRYVR